MDLTALKETVRTTLALNLNCQGGCRIALVADPTPFDRPEPELPDRAALAELFAEEALALGAKPFVILYPPTGTHGSEPPTDAYRAVYPPAFCEYADRHSLWTALLAKSLDPEARAELVKILREEKPRFDALLGLTKYSFSHTQFRQMLCESGVRAATMPRVRADHVLRRDAGQLVRGLSTQHCGGRGTQPGYDGCHPLWRGTGPHILARGPIWHSRHRHPDPTRRSLETCQAARGSSHQWKERLPGPSASAQVRIPRRASSSSSKAECSRLKGTCPVAPCWATSSHTTRKRGTWLSSGSVPTSGPRTPLISWRQRRSLARFT